MRIASSPTLRIATGLLLAVLLSVVGYQVVRRLNSHGPEALLKRADGFVRLVRVDLTKPSYPSTEQRVNLRSPAPHAMVDPAHLISVIRSLVAATRHDPAVDFLLPSDPFWSQSVLCTRPISSQCGEPQQMTVDRSLKRSPFI